PRAMRACGHGLDPVYDRVEDNLLHLAAVAHDGLWGHLRLRPRARRSTRAHAAWRYRGCRRPAQLLRTRDRRGARLARAGKAGCRFPMTVLSDGYAPPQN